MVWLLGGGKADREPTQSVATNTTRRLVVASILYAARSLLANFNIFPLLSAAAGRNQRVSLGRSPATSINFLTAHDGFTLADLVSYNHKHNLANGEHNRDGHDHNQSWNCGEEGPSLDANVNLRRRHVRKALMASLLLAHGTPMLLAGDEFGHTQQGNNNVYCQDNELTWLDWAGSDHEMVAFVSKLITIRKEIPALTNDCWWTGQPDVTNATDVTWLNPTGSMMTLQDWDDKVSKALMIRLSHDWLLLVNGSGHRVNFNLPQGNWRLRLSTADDLFNPGSLFAASPHSVTVLTRFSEGVQDKGFVLRRVPGLAWFNQDIWHR